jgi:hypothetical protein
MVSLTMKKELDDDVEPVVKSEVKKEDDDFHITESEFHHLGETDRDNPSLRPLFKVLLALTFVFVLSFVPVFRVLIEATFDAALTAIDFILDYELFSDSASSGGIERF